MIGFPPGNDRVPTRSRLYTHGSIVVIRSVTVRPTFWTSESWGFEGARPEASLARRGGLVCINRVLMCWLRGVPVGGLRFLIKRPSFFQRVRHSSQRDREIVHDACYWKHKFVHVRLFLSISRFPVHCVLCLTIAVGLIRVVVHCLQNPLAKGFPRERVLCLIVCIGAITFNYHAHHVDNPPLPAIIT